MNINSPIFVPQQHLPQLPQMPLMPTIPPMTQMPLLPHMQQLQYINGAPNNDVKSRFGSPTANMANWNYMLAANANPLLANLNHLNYYQRQQPNMSQQQQHFNKHYNKYFPKYNFYNANQHYYWANMAILAQQQQQHFQQMSYQQQHLMQQLQQQTEQQQKKHGYTENCDRKEPITKIVSEVQHKLSVPTLTTTKTKTKTTSSACVKLEVPSIKYDTMPDDGSIGQLYVSTPEDVLQPESAQQLSPTAQLQPNNAYDCGILIVQNENQQNNGHGNQQNGHNTNAKQRKGRHNNKRQDGNNAAQKQRHAATDFVVENWLGNNMKYCYESRRSALYGGDCTVPGLPRTTTTSCTYRIPKKNIMCSVGMLS